MTLSQNKKSITGVFALLTVNIIWVLSSELTNHIFITGKYNKPFLVTYLKCSLFSFLLFGFICSTHWKMISCPQKYYSSSNNEQSSEEINDQHNDINILGEPSYVLINYESSGDENNAGSDDDFILINPKVTEESAQSNGTSKRTVKFCKYKEVRHLSDTYAEESLAARMSYNATRSLQRKRMTQRLIDRGFFPTTYVIRFAVQFCFWWFIANYAYQKSLSTTIPAAVNIISGASSLFTLILAALFPSSSKDKFSLTKLFVVFLSCSGVILTNITEFSDSSKFQYPGIIWSLVASVGYAICLVNLRRNVRNARQISVVMFLGFVGLWILVTLWPALFILGWADLEKFEVPTGVQFGFILVNGLFGTVGAGLLWLWGCFLTSSLTATLSMGLTIPLSMATDYFIKKKVYGWVLYLGSIPILASFIAIAYLANKTGPPADPLGDLIHRIFSQLTSKPRYQPLADHDPDIDTHTSTINSGTDADADKLTSKSIGPFYDSRRFLGHLRKKTSETSQFLINGTRSDQSLLDD